jgi:multidrug efflux pump subunit AcrA (membrane-fusion protein)
MFGNKKVTTLVMITILSAFVIVGCGQLGSQDTPTPEPVQVQNVTPIVSATGVIVPAEYTTLSMSTTGLVEDVLVEEGDKVNAGDVLVRLKGREELQASIAAAKFELSAAQKTLDDLNDQAETSATQALDAISRYTTQVKEAQYQLDNFTVPIDQEELEPMDAVDIMKEKLDQAREAFEPYKNRSSSDTQRRDRKEDLDNAQSDYNVAVRRLEYVTAVEVAQANLDKARKDYEIYRDGPDPAAVKVSEARLENARATLSAAEAALEDLELQALFDGTVTELYIRAGEWVTPGQPIIQLADLAHLQVETTDLNEIDAAQVKSGSTVIVSFDALVDEVVQGTVKSIAPKASAGSGVNYTVIIELDELPEALRWGMTAFVDIEVE